MIRHTVICIIILTVKLSLSQQYYINNKISEYYGKNNFKYN